MSDFETRSRRAAAAMRRQAESIADIDAALSQIEEGSTVTALDTRDRRRWRRPLLAVGALAVGAAAALIGIAVIDDGEAIVEPPPATEPATPTTQVPTPSTAPVTAPPSTVPPSTGVPPTTRPEDWVPTQPPPPDPPAKDDVPYLGVGFVGGDFYEKDFRIEPAWAPRNEGAYVQAYSNADGSRSLYVETNAPRREVIVEPIPGTIGPWDLFDGSGEYLGLTLATDDISVDLDSNWLGIDQLRAIAERLGPRPDGGPGWDLGPLPEGFELAGEGYSWIGDTRTYLVVNDGADPDFPLAQLDVTTGVDGGMGFALAPYLPGREDQVVDFDGTRARFERFDDGGKLTWEYADGAFVTFWLSDVTQLQLGPGERVSARSFMATARNSVEELSEDEWRQTAALPPGGGCQTFSC